jgi:hypothetical protein
VFVLTLHSNSLNPSGYYIYQLICRTEILHFVQRVYLCVSYGNKQAIPPPKQHEVVDVLGGYVMCFLHTSACGKHLKKCF